MSVLFTQEENSYLFDLVGKIWAAQSSISSCVSSSAAPRYSHGNEYLLHESQTDQCGPFLIWT